MGFASKSGNPVFLKHHSLALSMVGLMIDWSVDITPPSCTQGDLGLSQLSLGKSGFYTLDKLSVHHGHVLRQTTICTRLRTILEFLELGREPTKTQAEQNPHITE